MTTLGVRRIAPRRPRHDDDLALDATPPVQPYVAAALLASSAALAVAAVALGASLAAVVVAALAAACAAASALLHASAGPGSNDA